VERADNRFVGFVDGIITAGEAHQRHSKGFFIGTVLERVMRRGVNEIGNDVRYPRGI